MRRPAIHLALRRLQEDGLFVEEAEDRQRGISELLSTALRVEGVADARRNLRHLPVRGRPLGELRCRGRRGRRHLAQHSGVCTVHYSLFWRVREFQVSGL